MLEIEAEIIPTTIVSAGEAFKRSLNARDINILNTDLKSMYLKNFIKRDMGYIHSTVAKALLFSPKVEVQTEKLSIPVIMQSASSLLIFSSMGSSFCKSTIVRTTRQLMG